MIFRVYRSINDGNLVPLKDVIDETTYTDTDLLPNTKFGYAISYFDGDTESKMSDVLSVQVGDVPITGVTLALKTNPAEFYLKELADYRTSTPFSKKFDSLRDRADFVDKNLIQISTNVRWYGAVGDGVADDTSAVIDAINAAISQGSSLYFPSGTYVLSKTINLSNISIFGSSVDNTILLPKNVNILFQIGSNVCFHSMTILNKNNGADIVDFKLGSDQTNSENNEISNVLAKGEQSTYKSTFLLAAPTGVHGASHHVWPNTIRDITLYNVQDGIVFDSANFGWINGNIVENVNVIGFFHSAIWLNSSALYALGITQNTFRNIQAEYLPATPISARAFIVNCGVDNRFEMIHTWIDGGKVIPSLSVIRSNNIAQDYFIRRNIFSGIFESAVEAGETTKYFNDFSKIVVSKWLGNPFFGSIFSIDSFNNQKSKKNLLSDDLIEDFSRPNVVSPIQFGGDVKMTNVSSGIDKIGPYLQINAEKNTDNLLMLIPVNSFLKGQIKNIGSATLGIDFEIGSSDNVANARIVPTVLFANQDASSKSVMSVGYQQAAQNIDGTYRYTAVSVISPPSDSSISNPVLSFSISGVMSSKIRKVFVVGGSMAISNQVDRGHSSKPYGTTLASGTNPSSYSDLGIFMMPKASVANYPDFNSAFIESKTNADGNKIVTYPLYE